MNNDLLILSAPAQTLLELGIFAGISAVCLLALSIEADNYTDLLEWMRDVRGALLHYRSMRRRLLQRAFVPRLTFA